jgi:VWFA-related protein
MHSERSRRVQGIVVLLVIALALIVSPVLAGKDKEKDKRIKDLPPHWRIWIEESVYPLIDSNQIKAFLELETEAQRRAFADRLWVLWGRKTGYGSAFRTIYEERLALARTEFDNTHNDRARVMLIHGPPSGRMQSDCPEVFVPLDIWYWNYIEGLGEGIVALFYQPYGMGPFRLWNQFETREVLYVFSASAAAQAPVRNMFERIEMRCANGPELLRAIMAAERSSKDLKIFAAMQHLPRMEKPGRESSSARFMEFSALLPGNYDPVEFTVTEAPRDLRGGKVLMGFNVKVPSEKLGTTEVGDVEVTQIDVVGEISREDEMVDRFRYLFTVQSGHDDLTLLLERSLRPGDYDMRVKIEDPHSRAAGVSEIGITARPPTEEELDALRRKRQAVAPAVTEVEVVAPVEEKQTLILLGPEGEGISGLQRFEAFTEPEVTRVTFLLDGDEVLTKNRPPFSVDLDLGPLPRLSTVIAVGYDKTGVEIDRKELSLNVGRERFYVRLQPFAPGDREGNKLRVAVEVNTPSDKPFERLELYWNDLLLAQLFQDPFEAWVDIGASSNDFGYLRAVAITEDGSQAEDIQFVNAPRFSDTVDVTAVELPVSVFNRDKEPILNLTIDDFTVLENGVEQTLTQCSLHKDLPVRLGIVIDTSGSMEETLPEVQRVVMGFLRDFVRPRDRAFVEVFSDIPEVLAPFTADFETLENALLALFPDRSTAFHDAVILGLFEFSGVRGRRAMVVLTDGADTASQHTYDEVVDFAQRSWTTIYTIGIGIKPTEVMTRHHLSNLAKVTGGRSFFLDFDSNLDRVYDEINRELRTQYVLAYTSSTEAPADELRKVKVKVERKGATVTTISGYYPSSF